jgi:hypothetical protein
MVEFTKNTTGRLISFSKSSYRNDHPANIIAFNASIFTKSNGRIWYGDLDITLDEEDLKQLAVQINETVYVLRESVANLKSDDKLDQATVTIHSDGSIIHNAIG